MGSNLQNVYWVNQKFKSSIDAAYNTDKNILDNISCSGSTELLKTSNLTLKREQFCIPREGNPENVLLTCRICLKYFYQWI